MMPATPATRRKLADFVEEHFYKRGGKVKESTLRTEESTVRKLAEWWDGQRRAPQNLDAQAMDDFLHGPDGLRKPRKPGVTEMRNNSYNKQLGYLKPFVQRMVRAGIWDGVLLEVLEDARRKVENRSYVRLTLSQVQEACEGAPDPFERWVVAFSTLSMGRENELQATRMSDFDLVSRKIRWDRKKVGKFGDGLPMFDQLVTEYEKWRAFYIATCPDIDGTAYVVPSRVRGGRGITWTYRPHMYTEHLGEVIKRNYARVLQMPVSALPGQAAHMARRSGARIVYDTLRDAGIPDPLRVTQAMLGHDQQRTTEIYIGLEADREYRDDIVLGAASKLLNWTPSNVTQLRAATS